MKNMQDIVLNTIRKEKISAIIITTNGYQMKDVYITGFDSFSIMIEKDGVQTLLFKHAISSITPSKRINISEEEQK